MSPTQQRSLIESIGYRTLEAVRYAGGMAILLRSAARVTMLGIFTERVRLPVKLFYEQVVRLGVKSIGIVVLVQTFIGVILALQMAPPLADYGQEAQIAPIIGVAGFRMLGPIITAVVLSGFAGASIAAELGTMVVAEEIEAMEAMAISPIRFLVIPRVCASVVACLLLAVLADVMICVGGYITAKLVLGPTVYTHYWRFMRDILEYRDLFSGLVMAVVFGLLIALIASYEGLRVTGGAEGVGRATTMTVVYSIVAIVVAACIFTIGFYLFGF